MTIATRPPTLRRSLIRATLGAVSATCLLAGGVLYVGGATTTAERTDRTVSLSIGVALVLGVSWLWPRMKRATERQLLTWTIIGSLPLLAVTVYGTLAVFGVLPPTPWSPMGQTGP